MMKQLQIETIRADLSAVDALLRHRSSADDPVGWFQFNQRKVELESQLAELQSTAPKAAAVALYFGGRPVLGSRGILADFGARAIDSFQKLVSTRFAALEGPLGERGPVAQRDRSALMITEVTHGSFGFVLEEPERPSPELPVTSLMEVVDQVCDLIHSVANTSEGDDDLEGTVSATLDRRVLGDLQQFFRLLLDAGATLRVVEGRRDFSLRPEMIALAKERTDAMNMEETTEQVRGRLFILPESRRFELHPVGGAPALSGPIAPEALPSIFDEEGSVISGLIGNVADADLRVRELKFRQQPGRRSYQLVRVAMSGAR